VPKLCVEKKQSHKFDQSDNLLALVLSISPLESLQDPKLLVEEQKCSIVLGHFGSCPACHISTRYQHPEYQVQYLAAMQRDTDTTVTPQKHWISIRYADKEGER
jgi:hypothetical protein